jgi:hypothetical protein
MKRTFTWLALGLATTLVTLVIPVHADEVKGNLKAKGAFTCDFGLSADLPMDLVGPTIERDRMYQAARQGFQRKLIPLSFAADGLEAGGRYLFDSRDDAEAYKVWIQTAFVLDGTQFFDRPYFLAPDCHAWSVIAAHDFADLHAAQVVLRTERWYVPHASQRKALMDRWSAILDAAAGRGLTSVWLLYNKQEQLVSLVYFADRVVPSDPSQPDFASLFALQGAPPLGEIFDDQGWTRTFDRTQWVLSIWFPFVLGDRGGPSLWPNSPPFPQPYAGDGVCEVSRGENHVNAPSDCPATCGDGVAQPGETTQNCPGDVRLDDE